MTLSRDHNLKTLYVHYVKDNKLITMNMYEWDCKIRLRILFDVLDF